MPEKLSGSANIHVDGWDLLSYFDRKAAKKAMLMYGGSLPEDLFWNNSDLRKVGGYEQSVLMWLHQLRMTKTGTAVLGAIGLQSQCKLTIKPYTDELRKQDPANAYASQLSATDAYPANVLLKTGKPDDPATPGVDESIASTKLLWWDITFSGTGEGSDVDILFSPDMWVDGGSGATAVASWGGTVTGASPDQILLHEMLHALRQMSGHLNQVALTGPLANYHDQEEFFAVLISNIYMSEQGKTNLRANHSSFSPMRSDLATGGFLTDATLGPLHRRLVEQFCDEEPWLCMIVALTCSLASFNPIRDVWNARNMGRP